MTYTRLKDHPLLSRTSLAVFLAVAMVGGFLCNRVVLSLSMMLFGLNALRGISPRQWLKQRWWLLGLVWIAAYVLSWFWSDDKAFWADRVQTKLPFLLLPLAFGLLPAFSDRQLRVYTTAFCLMLLAGIAYSISFFIGDPHAYINGYRTSHLLPTPAHRDHIRFSMTVTAGIAWGLYMLPKIPRRRHRILLGACMAVFAGYLHLLAAKTGLIAFYLLAVCVAVYQLFRRKPLAGLLLLLVLSAGGFLATRLIPTLGHRVGYTLYSYQQLTENRISGDYSDVGRLISYDLAIREIRAHPLTGIGAGDLRMQAAYDRWYPQIPEAQRLVPHNQFLAVGVAAGLIALGFFCWWVCAPLSRLRRGREGFFLFTTWLLLLFFLMTDASLEVQSGVFVYLFFLLWQRHVFLHATGQHPRQHEL